jgi:hypothetical protein
MPTVTAIAFFAVMWWFLFLIFNSMKIGHSMKKFVLLMLFNHGWHSGNKVLGEVKANTHKEASDYFAALVPEYNLKEGYSKPSETLSYCVAEVYNCFD